MKVYIVTRELYSSDPIVTVFSSKEFAEAFIARYPDQGGYEKFQIVEASLIKNE